MGLQIFTILSSVVFVIAATCICLGTSQTSDSLRSTPIKRIFDGLKLQHALIDNRDSHEKALWFLPNAPSMTGNKKQRELVHTLLKMVQKRDALNCRPHTDLVEAMKHVLSKVIADSCAYVSTLLDTTVDCNKLSEIRLLAKTFELEDLFSSLFHQMRSKVGSGTHADIRSYWDENVNKTCTPCSCVGVGAVWKSIVLPRFL